MAPPNQTHSVTEIPLDGFTKQDIEALEKIAKERSISFDEACKQLLLKRSRELRADRGPGLFARLFGIGVVR